MTGQDDRVDVVVRAIVQDFKSRILLQQADTGSWELPGRSLIPEAGVPATVQIHLNDAFAIWRVCVVGQHVITLGPSPEERGQLMVLADCGPILDGDIDHEHLATKPGIILADWFPVPDALRLLDRRQSAGLEYALYVRPCGGHLHMPWDPDIDARLPDAAGFPSGPASRASTPGRGISTGWPNVDQDRYRPEIPPAEGFASTDTIAEVTFLDTRRPRS